MCVGPSIFVMSLVISSSSTHKEKTNKNDPHIRFCQFISTQLNASLISYLSTFPALPNEFLRLAVNVALEDTPNFLAVSQSQATNDYSFL